jgi:hypothetical protein
MSTTSFQEVLEQLRQGMLDAYSLDENGEPQDLTEEQQAEIEDITTRVIEEANASFEPYCSELLQRIQKQDAEIAELKMRLSQPSSQAPVGAQQQSSASSVAAGTVSDGIPVPTVEWVAANRKSGKSTPVTGYNVWTTAYCATLKQGRPPKGAWDKINKKPWDDLAALYNQNYSSGKPARTPKVGGGVAGVSGAAPIVVQSVSSGANAVGAASRQTTPVIKAGTTAYMLWRDEYYAKNGHLPQKGTWNAQPQHVLDEYKARIKAAHAEIA